MHKRRLYIAYGSNLNLPQMAHRCPTTRVVGTSEIKDYELLFRGGRRGAVATIEPKQGSAVPVLLWDIKPPDEKALNRYEGFPNLYGKQMMDVELNGRIVPAMVYVMTPGHAPGLPSDDYLNIIAEGYKTARFDLGVLAAAMERSGELLLREMEKAQEFVPAWEPEDDWPESEQGSLFSMEWW